MSTRFPIVTDRTVLRRLTPADLAAFQHYRHDEEVGRYQGWLPQTDAEATALLEKYGEAEFFQPGIWFQVGIADRESDALIGDIGTCLSASAPEAEIGFSICRESQGRGLGTEAIGVMIEYLFERTEIRRVIGVTDARNIAAMKLLKRLGMQRLQTNKAMFRGLACEEHLFALDRDLL